MVDKYNDAVIVNPKQQYIYATMYVHIHDTHMHTYIYIHIQTIYNN